MAADDQDAAEPAPPHHRPSTLAGGPPRTRRLRRCAACVTATPAVLSLPQQSRATSRQTHKYKLAGATPRATGRTVRGRCRPRPAHSCPVDALAEPAARAASRQPPAVNASKRQKSGCPSTPLPQSRAATGGATMRQASIGEGRDGAVVAAPPSLRPPPGSATRVAKAVRCPARPRMGARPRMAARRAGRGPPPSQYHGGAHDAGWRVQGRWCG